MSDFDNDNGQNGPAVWADEVGLVPPPMRTFKVVLDPILSNVTVVQYVDAHSVTCLDDAAHFYVYRVTQTDKGPALAAYMVRTLRPYLDVEDVSGVLAQTSKSMN